MCVSALTGEFPGDIIIPPEESSFDYASDPEVHTVL